MTVGFIGFGHMASAICKGLIKSDYAEPREMFACAADFEKLKERAAEVGVRAVETPEEVAREAGIIFVCVKPGQVKEVLMPIVDDLVGRLIISVAFGVDFDDYEEIFSKSRRAAKIKHISVIPNTPVEVCQGITICEEKHNLDAPELEMVKGVLRKLGEIEFLPTEIMWLGGELASCGPAYAAMFIEALGDAGVKYGLEREAAYRIVSQMVAGTGHLQVETGKNPGKMAQEVATPGGVTIKGAIALQEGGFHDLVGKAIDAIEQSKESK